MKILYLCNSDFGGGNGGHFYSLLTTAEELQKTEETYIVSTGKTVSSVFRSMNNYYPIVSISINLLQIPRLIKFVRKNQIDVIHSFDMPSYFLGRIISIITRKPLLHTKCGGPSPSKHYPCIQDLVLFSTENLRYFQNNKKYKNLYHIPNRVKIPPQDQNAILELRKRLRPNTTIFMRIARFSKEHKKSIIDSINLINTLANEGMNVQLLLIGFIYDEEVYENILVYQNQNVIFVTEEKFTIEASRLLSVAEVVIGTGRGAMEAAMLGKILLGPTISLDIPALVDEKNIHIFSDYNFSSRTPLQNMSEKGMIKNISNILSNETKKNKLRNFIYDYADKNFNISTIRDKYIYIYSHCLVAKSSFIDIIKQFLFSIYSKNIKPLIK